MTGRWDETRQSGFTADEIAAGMPFGLAPVRPRASVERSPRAALEQMLIHALRHAPCLIAFSGGRDSSALLAVAVDVARRNDLSPPVPVTLRFKTAAAEESDWQELVLRHLGLEDWVRLEIGDELDMLGPVATRGLERHGLMYPANAHLIVPMAKAAAGGTILTGVGGDDAFGEWPWHDVASLLARRRAPRAADARRLVHWAAPRALHTEIILRREPLRLPWIVPSERGRLARLVAQELASQPRTWKARALWPARWQLWRQMIVAMDQLARDEGASLGSPFLEERFLAALGVAGQRWGWGNRSATMRALFGDLLPEVVITRRSKAEFSQSLFGPYTKAFAAGWGGRAGAASHLVDPQVLRNVWLTDRPHFHSAMLLQAAWLAENAVPAESAARAEVAVAL